MNSAPSTDTHALLQQGLARHHAGRVGDAAVLYRRVLHATPLNAVARHLLGLALHQSGHELGALEQLRLAASYAPEDPAILNDLGNLLLEMSAMGDAEQVFRRALEGNEKCAMLHNNLGAALREQGRFEEACDAFRRALDLDPDTSSLALNLAAALRLDSRPFEAMSVYRGLLARDPACVEARQSLVRMLLQEGRIDEARAALDAWLARDPTDPGALHIAAACGNGAVPERAADSYVEQLFDAYAATFDAHLEQLRYRGPDVVARLLETELTREENGLDVLDAGCGTGLYGSCLRSWAASLEGVDLSARMLEQAAGRGVYDELVQGELTAHLQERQEVYDLVVAADTLNYFGDLRDVLEAAVRSLRSGGRFVFTIECADQAPPAGFRLETTGRYSHTERHLEQRLAQAGLTVRSLSTETLRHEGGRAVQALVVCARKD